MNNYVNHMEDYWNGRYSKEDKIWGMKPSATAVYAVDIFQKNNIHSVFIPGVGYGRNAKLFTSLGMKVSGIEISKKAIATGQIYNPETSFIHGSVLDLPLDDNQYEGLYCFNVLHLFREKEREALIEKCIKMVSNNGLLFFTVFSEKEDSFKRGTEVEPNTFESKPGRPVHYYTSEDLQNCFTRFDIIDMGLIADEENHGEGPHIHQLRYVCIRK